MALNDPKLEVDLPGLGQKLLVLVIMLLSLPAIYNIYFHPLAGIPGPFFAKISDLWHAYHVSTGARHTLLGELHDKYGPLIRLGPATVSVNTSDGLQKVFSAMSPIDKSPFYKAFTPGFDSSFSSLGQDFKEKKSILSHAFAQKKLDAMEKTFMEHTGKLCDIIAKRSAVELDECLSALTIDILSDVCFGETFDLLHNREEKTRISKGLEYAAKFVSLEGTLWRWPVLQKVIRMSSHACTTRSYPAQRAMGAMLNQRRQASVKGEIFNHLLAARKGDTGETFSEPELLGEAIVLFIAGSDTTATALLTTMWHLLRHKRAYETVIKEVRSAFGSIHEITYQEAQHLPYLKAVIEESLRIFPPNSGFIPRQVLTSEQPFILHDVALPAGTEIGVSNLSLHRNSLYFDDPDEFVPERWINGDNVKKYKPAFSPFSKGPRACLGRNMAYMEMTLVLAALITEFDMDFEDPQKEFERGYTPTDSFVLLRPRVNIIAKQCRA